jgi:hypothetical protein
MCEPVTIAYAAAAAFAAYGAYTTSQSNKAQGEYQSAVAESNAKVANWQAEDSVVRGGEAAIQQQRQAERMRGTQVARLASNGLDISSGTPLAILEDTMFFGAQDANIIRNNAAREAWGHKVQASGSTASSMMYASAARAENPGLAAGTSLLSSAGQYGMSGGFNSGAKTSQSGRS